MPEHQWQKKDSYHGSPYDERVCPVCKLEDMRSKHGDMHRKKNDGWKVSTPCIEPVPDRVEFDELVTELNAHPVQVEINPGIRRMKTFDDVVFCKGRPGRWRVGLDLFDGVFPDDYKVTHLTLELGFAALLRWMRARQYNPYLYSDLYRKQESARVREFSGSLDDD